MSGKEHSANISLEDARIIAVDLNGPDVLVAFSNGETVRIGVNTLKQATLRARLEVALSEEDDS